MDRVSGRGRFDRLLRWYPEAWRQRYGDELIALMEDTYDDRPVPWRCRMSLARSGAVERLRGSGLAQGGDGSGQRIRSGSLLVLWAWAVFVVAGAGFAKFAEHWDAVTPKGARWLPAAAFDAVQWAALTGGVIVLVAASASVPAFVRSMARGGWAPIRLPVLRAVAVAAATVVATVGIVVWAHHLGPRPAGRAHLPYAGVAALWALMVVATIATGTAAAVAVARRLRFSPRVLRLQGVLALAMVLVMVVVVAGTIAWWGAVAANAPWFFDDGVIGSTTSRTPPALVGAGVLMVLGLAVALPGAIRVARSLPTLPTE
jgi:hypothetical protein